MKLVTGTHCMPCKMLHNWLDENNIKINDILDSEKDLDTVKELGIKQTPTLVLDDGTLIAGLETIKEYLSKGEE